VDRLTAGDYSGAIADFTQALQLEPKDADAYYNRGYAELVLGQVRASDRRLYPGLDNQPQLC
jgi:Flp pilus assembly protein TadD